MQKTKVINKFMTKSQLNLKKRVVGKVEKMLEPWLIAPIAAVISIVVGLVFYRYVEKQDSGTEKMREISDAIRKRRRCLHKT